MKGLNVVFESNQSYDNEPEKGSQDLEKNQK